MTITPQTIAPTGPVPCALREDRVTYGAVHLQITDLERSLGFWRDLIGLTELASDSESTALGVEGRPLVVLHPKAVRRAGRGHAGLYHLAIHLPDPVEFARVLVRLAGRRVPQAPTDHIFSKATYVNDPDGIMLELTLETPERYGSIDITPRGVLMFDSDGRPRNPTEALELTSAIAPLAGADPEAPLPPGTYVGHVHLHVPELRAAYDFYRSVIGFSEHAYMTPIHMADLGAGGAFPHRIAINDWHGPSARQAPPGTAGMSSYELILRNRGALTALGARADTAGASPAQTQDGSLALCDPAGNLITVREAGE